MENWKPCDWLDGYGGLLEVSDHARVRRSGYKYMTTSRWGTPMAGNKPDKTLSHDIGKRGYAIVSVQVNGKRKKFFLHHLVARAFVEGYAEGLTVNHIDGIKTNNLPHNLEWVTRARNSAHAWEIGLVDLRGENAPGSKLTSGQVRIIRELLADGVTSGKLAILAGVSTSTIDLIKSGARWNSVV